MPQDRDPGLEAGVALDRAGENVADSALGEPDVPERVLLRLAAQLALQLGNVCAFGDDDDAEELALAAAAVEVGDDVRQRDLVLRDDDQVGAACDSAHQSHPTRVAAHDLHHHHAMVRGGGCVQPIQRLGDDADRGVEADAELRD